MNGNNELKNLGLGDGTHPINSVTRGMCAPLQPRKLRPNYGSTYELKIGESSIPIRFNPVPRCQVEESYANNPDSNLALNITDGKATGFWKNGTIPLCVYGTCIHGGGTCEPLKSLRLPLQCGKSGPFNPDK